MATSATTPPSPPPADEPPLPAGLYVVATPIGCLEDITLRALRVLRTADRVLCEDTRRTGILLAHFGIRTTTQSYHMHNEHGKLARVLEDLKGGAALALVSDAGVPAINDPGAALIAAAVEAGVAVVPVPGPSATLTALVGAGLPTASFTFCGFTEAKSGGRKKQFTMWKDLDSTLIFFVSPHSLLGALEDAVAVFGADRRCCLGRELTKTHEEFWRSSLAEALAEFEERGPRGEFTMVIEGAGEGGSGSGGGEVSDEAVLEELQRAVEAGASPSQAARQVAEELGVNKKRAYNMSLKLKAAAEV
jgi:16S rRNA (cytidine1402-2'-O)-methyltransferase